MQVCQQGMCCWGGASSRKENICSLRGPLWTGKLGPNLWAGPVSALGVATLVLDARYKECPWHRALSQHWWWPMVMASAGNEVLGAGAGEQGKEAVGVGPGQGMGLAYLCQCLRSHILASRERGGEPWWLPWYHRMQQEPLWCHCGWRWHLHNNVATWWGWTHSQTGCDVCKISKGKLACLQEMVKVLGGLTPLNLFYDCIQ